ncbi:MAG TPA: copper-binding protein [Thiobacillus sp.]|nr:copper-binding protein [Thiobacillus sp.]
MKRLIPLLAALAIATPLYAQPVTPPAAQAGAMSEGVVRKIDAENARITLKHGPIVNLDMPAMSMVFRVQPPELLSAVKVGDTVKFHAEKINGAYTVTALQVAQ